MGQAVRTVLIHYHYSEKRNQSAEKCKEYLSELTGCV